MDSLREFCTRGLWVQHGRLVADGPIDDGHRRVPRLGRRRRRTNRRLRLEALLVAPRDARQTVIVTGIPVDARRYTQAYDPCQGPVRGIPCNGKEHPMSRMATAWPVCVAEPRTQDDPAGPGGLPADDGDQWHGLPGQAEPGGGLCRNEGISPEQDRWDGVRRRPDASRPHVRLPRFHLPPRRHRPRRLQAHQGDGRVRIAGPQRSSRDDLYEPVPALPRA